MTTDGIDPRETETETERKELHAIILRMEFDKWERIKKMADYAVLEGFIPSDHRGNVTAFINWCISEKQEELRLRAQKKRGFL